MMTMPEQCKMERVTGPDLSTGEEVELGPAICGPCSNVVQDYVQWEGHNERERDLIRKLGPRVVDELRYTNFVKAEDVNGLVREADNLVIRAVDEERIRAADEERGRS